MREGGPEEDIAHILGRTEVLGRSAEPERTGQHNYGACMHSYTETHGSLPTLPPI